MKKLTHFILILGILLGLSWTLWIGFKKQAAKPLSAEPTAEAGKDGDAAAKDEDAPEDYVVKLDKAKWQALEIEKGEPEKMELKPQRVAFGRVIDPTPLITLEGDQALAEAALEASRAENERTQKLLAAGENTSRKVAETAMAQFRTDEIKVESFRRRARLEWGALLPALDPGKRREFVEQLVRGEASLIRVDILPGDALVDAPKHARIVVLGRESQPVDTDWVTPAADVDPKTQAQGYLLRVDKAPFAIQPGMALSAWLELPQKPRPGFAVPRSAILRHDGRAWIYVQEEEEKFVRKPVTLDTPLDGDKGWFLSEQGGGLKAEDLLIITGAQSLLSEELKAQGGGAKAD